VWEYMVSTRVKTRGLGGCKKTVFPLPSTQKISPLITSERSPKCGAIKANYESLDRIVNPAPKTCA